MSKSVLIIAGAIAGGVGKHVFDLIIGLHQQFDLSFAYSTKDTDSDYHTKLNTIVDQIGADNALPLKIGKLPGPRDISNLRRLRAFARKHGVAVVHGHGAKGGAYARLLAILCPEIRAIYTPHGGAVHPMHGSIGNRGYASIEKMLYRHTDCCLFESEYTRRMYFARFGREANQEKSRVNYNGIDLTPISSPASAAAILANKSLPNEWLKNRSPNQIHCCCIALIRQIKGQWVLLNAWKDVLAKHPWAYLHLIGGLTDPDATKGMIAEFGLQDRVLLYGDVAHARALLSLYDYCLIPSLFESFGYVAVEAMCEGIPVIASRTGALTEIIEDGRNGMLVEPGDAQAWIETLCRVFADRRLGSVWAECARKTVSDRFDLKKMLSNIRDVYHEFLTPPDEASRRARAKKSTLENGIIRR